MADQHQGTVPMQVKMEPLEETIEMTNEVIPEMTSRPPIPNFLFDFPSHGSPHHSVLGIYSSSIGIEEQVTGVKTGPATPQPSQPQCFCVWSSDQVSSHDTGHSSGPQTTAGLGTELSGKKQRQDELPARLRLDRLFHNFAADKDAMVEMVPEMVKEEREEVVESYSGLGVAEICCAAASPEPPQGIELTACPGPPDPTALYLAGTEGEQVTMVKTEPQQANSSPSQKQCCCDWSSDQDFSHNPGHCSGIQTPAGLGTELPGEEKRLQDELPAKQRLQCLFQNFAVGNDGMVVMLPDMVKEEEEEALEMYSGPGVVEASCAAASPESPLGTELSAGFGSYQTSRVLTGRDTKTEDDLHGDTGSVGIIPASQNSMRTEEDLYGGETEEEVWERDPGHTCEECGKSFPSAFKLKRHSHVHAQGPLFQCDMCGKKYIRAYSLTVHQRSHTGVKRFQCSVCEQRFTTKYSLEVHMRVHSGEKPYQCDQCQARFTQKGDLTIHKRKHSGEKPYPCHLCPMRFAASTRLNKHLRVVHQGIKPHICSLCPARFPTAGHLATHVKTHTGERPFTCDICKRCFIDSTKLRIHLRSHTGDRPYECKVCGARFARTTVLNNHMTIHTGVKRFQCDHCPARFSAHSAWLVHTRRHLGVKNYKCQVCEARFVDSPSLKLHVRTHTGEKPYCCILCPARFTTSSNLRKHRQTHLKLHLHQCSQCGRQFVTQAALQDHIQRHMGVTPHACPRCPRRFTQLRDLRKHMKVHNRDRERPHACRWCNGRFTSIRDLKRHAKRSHPEKEVRLTTATITTTTTTTTTNSRNHHRLNATRLKQVHVQPQL